MDKHVCPWWLVYFFHKPEKLFAPYLREGMTAADIGCGMGYFSIAMAQDLGFLPIEAPVIFFSHTAAFEKP